MTPPLPDVGAAFVIHTRALPNTSALIGNRVAMRRREKSAADPAGWPMPTFAIVYHKVPGPTPPRRGTTPVTWQPIQVECYGPDMRNADIVWRTLHAELFPDPPTPQGFIAANCAVMSIEQSGSAAPLQENPTDFPRMVATFLVQYCERPV